MDGMGRWVHKWTQMPFFSLALVLSDHIIHPPTYPPIPATKVKLEKLEADLEAENPWERVINLVDMQADVAPGKCDMARLKALMFQLKAEPLGAEKK